MTSNINEKILPPSPNWYCSRNSDWNQSGIYAVGVKNEVMLFLPQELKILGFLIGHENRITSVAFFQVSKSQNLEQEIPIQIVSGSLDHSIRIWNIETFKCINQFVNDAEINAIDTSPLEFDRVMGGDKNGKLISWKFTTDEKRSFAPLKEIISALRCSPIHALQVVIGYHNGMIIIFDTEKGEKVYQLAGHVDEIQSLSWSHPKGNNFDAFTLASASRDKTIRLWTCHGKLKTTFQVPKGSNYKAETQKSKIWITLDWSPFEQNELISSSIGGDLIIWNVKSKNSFKKLGQTSKTIFNICYSYQERKIICYSLDRYLSLWDIDTFKCVWNFQTIGSFVYSIDYSELDEGKLAIGLGDKLIRIWNTASSNDPFESIHFWKGIQSQVTMVKWHPTEFGILAFGTDDGRIGLLDIYQQKLTLFSSYHRAVIYELEWKPSITSDEKIGTTSSKQNSSGAAFLLFSCGGDGIVFQSDPALPSQNSIDINSFLLEKSGNEVNKKTFPKRSDFNWKPDGTVLALGNVDGSIDLVSSSYLHITTVHDQKKTIFRLKWHPIQQENAKTNLEKKCVNLLASASDDYSICIYEFKPSSGQLECIQVLKGHGGAVSCVVWNPHNPSQILSGSFDSTAQIWDVFSGQPLVNFRGHKGRIFTLCWHPFKPNLIFTGSEDQTVRIWNVNQQTETEPPKKTKTIVTKKKSEVVTETSTLILPASSSETSSKIKKKKKEKKKSILPQITTAFTSENKAQSQVNLIKIAESNFQSIEHDSLDVHLFSQNADIYNLLKQESSNHLESNNQSLYLTLEMWKGNISEVLTQIVDGGQIDASWLSLSPLAGMEVWRAMTKYYAFQLAEKGEYHQAVLHYLAINCVYEAVDVYKRAEMFNEAITLAKIRLPSHDPIIPNLFLVWGEKLEKASNFDKAAKCYLAANHISDAIRCSSIRGDLASLETASKLAFISKDPSAAEWSLKYGLELERFQDWKASQVELSKFSENKPYLVALGVAWIFHSLFFSESSNLEISQEELDQFEILQLFPSIQNLTNYLIGNLEFSHVSLLTLCKHALILWKKWGISMDQDFLLKLKDEMNSILESEIVFVKRETVHFSFLLTKVIIETVCGNLDQSLEAWLQSLYYIQTTGNYWFMIETCFCFILNLEIWNKLQTVLENTSQRIMLDHLNTFVSYCVLYCFWWTSSLQENEENWLEKRAKLFAKTIFKLEEDKNYQKLESSLLSIQTIQIYNLKFQQQSLIQSIRNFELEQKRAKLSSSHPKKGVSTPTQPIQDSHLFIDWNQKLETITNRLNELQTLQLKGVELPDPIESSLIFCWIYKFIIPSPSRLKAFIDWGKKYSFQEHQLQAFENLERGLEGN